MIGFFYTVGYCSILAAIQEAVDTRKGEVKEGLVPKGQGYERQLLGHCGQSQTWPYGNREGL